MRRRCSWWWWIVVCGVVCWGTWRPSLAQEESTADGNDCYRKPCQNGGTCIDMIHSYHCECPHNFNGTNCENDLAREYGCEVSPCENNGTCVTLSELSPGTLPYRCTCREGFTGVNCETLLDQCEMTPNPCQNGACTSTVNSYNCNCTGTGFRGKNCSEDIEECEEGSPCGTLTCFNYPGTYTCECPLGSDGPMCQDVDECLSSPCKNGATCTQGTNNYTCTCTPGFEDADCQNSTDDCVNVTCPAPFTHCVDGLLSYRCLCLDGYVNTTGVCVDIDECESNPCLNNATCDNQINAYRCNCLPGFNGTNCEVDIDDCESQPCLNNATCVDGVGSFTCHCVPGYAGNTCATDIDECISHQCRNGASCEDLVNGYHCACVEGWSGGRCTHNIDDCASHPCLNNATCNDFVAAYTCTCLLGFTGSDCETNMDDCSPDPCQNSAPCFDRVNDYFCSCPSQWMGKNCSQPYDACSFRPCQNNATCNTTVPQHEYTCTCLQGFNGTDCQYNIDDCVGNTCQHFEECYDGISNYTCACPTGFTGDQCGKEINECDPDPCQNQGLCNDYIGFYNCSCPQRIPNNNNYPTGYQGLNCDEDIDECAYDPPICQNGGTCTNKNGSYECRCLGQTPSGELVTGFNCQFMTSYCRVNGDPCQHGATCRNIFGTYACDCLPGFTDKNCSTNINECESSPCQYNSTCVDLVNGYECLCIPGITGTNCETDIDDCQNNPCDPGSCKDKIDNYECNCTDTGFKGRNCTVNINDCLPGICQHNGSCDDGIKSYTCNCHAGYTGSNCQTDIAECVSDPCQYNGTCLEYSNQSLYGQGRSEFSHFSYATAAGYLCDCIDGIEGVNCEVNIEDCVLGACHNNATCIDGIATYTCVCAPGYEGTTCKTEIDECVRYQPCRNSATCTDLVADYSCRCLEFNPSRPTFGGKNCSVRLTGCEAGNSCLNGQCVPVLVSETPVQHNYMCRCWPGFRGHYCDESTTMTFSSNGSLIRYSADQGHGQGGGNDRLSFRFRTTLTRAVLAVLTFSPTGTTFVSVEVEEGRLVVVFHDEVSTIPEGVESQEHVSNGKWHKASLDLGSNVSLTLLSEACGRERCRTQFSYPRGKPQDSTRSVYFGNMRSSLLSRTLTKGMYVGCLEDVLFDDVYLYSGLHEGYYENVTRDCPRSEQCQAYTCNRQGSCLDLWDSFRCDCLRPYWGTLCEKEYTKATFSRNGVPSLATFRLDSLSGTFSDGLDLSLFLRTRQKDGIVMYLTNNSTATSTDTFMTLEIRDGCLAARLHLCGVENNYFSQEKGAIDFGSLNFVRATLTDGVLLLRVNDSVFVNETLAASACPFRPSLAYFGKVPELHGHRQRRQAMTTTPPPTITQLHPYDGIIIDAQLQNRTLDFEPREGAQENSSVTMLSAESNVTLGAVSTVSMCNTSTPCENGGTCQDVFFNDFKCECPEGYLGKKCSQPDFCKPQPRSCPSHARCQSLQQGFECISVASFNGRSSVATYSHSLPGGALPSQRLSFRMRTRSFHGAVLEVRAPQGQNSFIKVRVRDGSLEVNYLLKPHGFSSSLRMVERVNDGQWYQVEMAVTGSASSSSSSVGALAMSLSLSRNGTILEEEGPEPLEDAVADLASLVGSGTLRVGDVADGKEQAFKGCLEEVRVGGILLPFVLDSTMNHNTALVKFSATALAEVGWGCAGPDVCQEGGGNLCGPHGRCQDVWNDYLCSCDPGYQGEFCYGQVDECAAGEEEGGGDDDGVVCLNGGLCLDGLATYSCVCRPGFTGARCDTPFDACDNSCANGSSCMVNPNLTRGYVCQCPDPNYSGDLCNVNIENKSCSDNLCNNSATCNDQNGSTFTCSCAPGYTGVLCETPINYCVDLPCNNGTCTSEAAQQNYTCHCNPGFTGDVCEIDIDECTDDACNNGGTCVDGINHYTCVCTTGWTGPRCKVNIDECDLQVCQHGSCTDQSPGYSCNCTNTGYTGTNCSLDLDECSHNFCVENTTTNCTNEEGDYHCNCNLGYQGKNCSQAFCESDQCQNGAICSDQTEAPWGTKWECSCPDFYGGTVCEKAGPCAVSPCNGTNTKVCQQDNDVFDLHDPSSGNFTCMCNTGWEGDQCEDDIDECDTPNFCQHGGTCDNQQGSFLCQCTLGYNGTNCQNDIDECATHPCLHGGVCTQGIGVFTCNCTGTGYEGDTCSRDVDECERLSSPPPCQNNNTCLNSPGSFSCQCSDQYLGDRCQHPNPCSPAPCQNAGACNHTFDPTRGSYLALCSCVNGYQGKLCQTSPDSDDDDLNLAIIIGPVVAAVLIIVVIAVIVFVMVARKKRATHGAYSPSRQETAGARVELGNVLKKPPEERLI